MQPPLGGYLCRKDSHRSNLVGPAVHTVYFAGEKAQMELKVVVDSHDP